MSSGLAGKRVVNTRAPHQSGDLDSLLVAAGAIPLAYPCIDIAPPEDTAPLDDSLRALGRFDWLLLTSANTVLALSRRLESLGIDRAALASLQVGTVGPTTAQAAREWLEVSPAAIPEEYTGESLAAVIPVESALRVLLPGSDIARTTLADALRESGVDVHVVTAYRTVIGHGGAPLGALLAACEVDAITFTSPSTVRNCAARLEAEGGSPGLMASVPAVCIGPTTAGAARKQGLTDVVTPEEYTLPGMLAALENRFRAPV